MNRRDVVKLDNLKGKDVINYKQRQSSGGHSSQNNNLHATSGGQSTQDNNVHATYKNEFPFEHCPSASPETEQIELTDMKNLTEFGNMTHRRISEDVLSKGNHQARLNTPLNRRDIVHDGSGRSRTYHRQQDAEPLVSSSASADNGIQSRHGSAGKIMPFRERSSSSIPIVEGSTRPRSSKYHGRYSLSAQHTSSCDEDDDISMEGLSELLGTVRQYAQEIREIYAPIQKEKEERSRKKSERNARKKNKDMNKTKAIKSDSHEVSPCHHEVRVEIHKTDEEIHERMLEEGRGTPRHEPLSHSKSYEPSPSKQVASLHIEAEHLSRTWPRGQQRSTSRERYLSDVTQNKQQTYTASSSNYFIRPKTPSDWSDAKIVQHEKEMLNKAFQRIQKPNDDPLLSTVGKIQPKSQIQEQMMNSRQSVIEVAKQHKQSRQTVLPSISIISPAIELRRMSWNSQGGALPSAPMEEEITAIQPSAPPLVEDEPMYGFASTNKDGFPVNKTTLENSVRQSEAKPTGEKISAEAGKGKRKITDQTLHQQSPTIDKY